jgi:isoaspartyl peptidase/L-asparaginase-like protein (Ntn-hydrolase superfamily)
MRYNLTELQAAGGEGGVIVQDGKGDFSVPFSSTGLSRGWIDIERKRGVGLYQDS